jgi:hypothetical protein
MIEEDTLFTVLGVILIGISYGLNSSYISQTEGSRLFGSVIPYSLNMIVMVYISYGLFNVSKLSDKVKVTILILFILISYIEISVIYQKPESWYGISSVWISTTVASLIRLYFIISLHCDLTKSLFVYVARTIVEPSKAVLPAPAGEPKQEPNWQKAWDTFEGILKKTELTKEEKMEQTNKFRAAWGKTLKEVVLTGGKQR